MLIRKLYTHVFFPMKKTVPLVTVIIRHLEMSSLQGRMQKNTTTKTKQKKTNNQRIGKPRLTCDFCGQSILFHLYTKAKGAGNQLESWDFTIPEAKAGN